MDFSLFIEKYQELILFGVLLNFVATVGFGIYKSLHLDSKQMEYLMDRYHVKNSTLKIIFYWFVPFMGYLLVLKDVLMLQRYLKYGFSVFDYVEDKLKREMANS
jgi:hypothetical protein